MGTLYFYFCFFILEMSNARYWAKILQKSGIADMACSVNHAMSAHLLMKLHISTGFSPTTQHYSLRIGKGRESGTIAKQKMIVTRRTDKGTSSRQLFTERRTVKFINTSNGSILWPMQGQSLFLFLRNSQELGGVAWIK